MDSWKVGQGILLTGLYVGDCREHCKDSCVGPRGRRGKEGCGSMLEMAPRSCSDRFRSAVHEVRTGASVDVNVDKAKRETQTRFSE